MGGSQSLPGQHQPDADEKCSGTSGKRVARDTGSPGSTGLRQVRPVWSSPWAVTFSSVESICSLVIVVLKNTSGSGCPDGKEPPSSFWANCSHKRFSLFAPLLCYCLAGGLKFPPPFSSAVFSHRHQMPFQLPLLLDKNASPFSARFVIP